MCIVPVVRGVRTGNRPGDAEPRLLLRTEVHVQPAGALLLRQAAVHHPARRQVLQLPEQVSCEICCLWCYYHCCERCRTLGHSADASQQAEVDVSSFVFFVLCTCSNIKRGTDS